MSSTWNDGTVTAIGPLQITLDGTTSALPYVPISLIDLDLLEVDDRVRCEIDNGRVIVHGREDGANPVVPDASTTVKGIAELADDTETVAGTDTGRVTTPHGVAAAIAAAIAAMGIAYRHATGHINHTTNINNGASTSWSVTFPSSFFTLAPNIKTGSSSTRISVQASSVTTSGFTLFVSNWSGTNAGQPFKFDWDAVQQLSGSADS